jgi:hypothetical protein
MKSEFRKTLEEQDKLGVNETFEARLRGSLTPYWTIASLLKEEDLDDKTLLELLRGFVDTNEYCMNQIKELLKNSELDREFLVKNLDKQ